MASVIGWAVALTAAVLSAAVPAKAQTAGVGSPPVSDWPEPTGPHPPSADRGETENDAAAGLSVGQRPSVAPAESWTDEEVVAVARALSDMAGVMAAGRQALAATEDDAARRAIEKRIFADMLVAVEDAGLTVERYNALVAAMNKDPELRDRVTSLLAPEAADEPVGDVPMP